MSPRRLPDEVRRRAIEMYRQGRPTPEITAETGLTRGSLYGLLKRSDVTPTRLSRRVDPVAERNQMLERLQAENDRLRAEVDWLRKALDKERARVDKLLALVDRLRLKEE